MTSLHSLPVRYPWLAWAVLAAGLAASAAAYLFVHGERELEARAAFAQYAGDAADGVELRMRAYGDLLYALRGLFGASSDVSRAEFRRFISGFGIYERYPGLLNVSYAQRVPHAGKQAFERQMRRETGSPDFAIQPPGERPEYHVLVYSEAEEGINPSVGMDFAYDPPRRDVIERARDTGKIAASEPIRRPGSTSGGASVLVRLAIYGEGAVPAELAERQRLYRGVVGVAINVEQMLRAALSRSQFNRVRLVVYDRGLAATADSETRNRGRLLYDSNGPERGAQSAPEYARFEHLALVRRMAVGDRTWSLHILPRADPAGLVDRLMPLAAAAAVATITLLLFGLLKALAAAEGRATHDKLTGLYNRHYVQEWLDLELKRAARHGRPLGAILCDIDHFKQVNDTHGHEAGDMVLREVAALLKRIARQSDVVCRYGGEEFLLLMPESPLAAAFDRAERLRTEMKSMPFVYQRRPIGPVTLSAGVAEFPGHGADRETLLRQADAALYQAKQGGRDRVVRAQSRAGREAV